MCLTHTISTAPLRCGNGRVTASVTEKETLAGLRDPDLMLLIFDATVP